MSSFSLTTELRDGYLLFKGEGIRNGIMEILEGTKQIAEAVDEANIHFLLVDYSDVITRVSSADIFNIVRVYESKAPLLIKTTIAVIINAADVHFEKFWEEICTKRGFNFKIFTEYPVAEKWLVAQIRG